MKTKKVMILCLVTVLALSLMGFGFAKWTDGVNLGAKVATGNVGVAIQGPFNIVSLICNVWSKALLSGDPLSPPPITSFKLYFLRRCMTSA